jgi:hypothetical protein
MLNIIEDFLGLNTALEEAKTQAATNAALAAISAAKAAFCANFPADSSHQTLRWAAELLPIIEVSLEGRHKLAEQRYKSLYLFVRFAE